MRIFSIFLLTLHLAVAGERPNILFIFSDDHALQAISSYGGRLKEVAPTPNIDRLAEEGAIFERSYCTNSICGPSRASILTGKHSHINGFIDNTNCTFDENQPTFPKYLQDGGYSTALIGKWHLYSNPVGFDHYEILPGQGRYMHPDFIQMDGSDKRETGYVTDIITDKALKWLKDDRDKDKPFLLMCQHKAPHRNWIPAPRHYNLFDDITIPEPATLFDDYSGRSESLKEQWMSIKNDFFWGWDMLMKHGSSPDPRFSSGYPNLELERMLPSEQKAFLKAYSKENIALMKQLKGGMPDKEVIQWKYQRYLQNYLRCVRALDENIGRMLEYLEESGLAENTIVIYSSDQGFYLGEHGWYDKRWMFEESFQMPFVIRWPGKIKPSTRSQALIQNIDYAPTFMDAAGIKVPDDIQGRSLMPVFKNNGKAPENWRDGLYYFYSGEAYHNVPAHDGVINDRYKIFYLSETKEWQMFDLKEDPNELKSVYGDPKYAEVQKDMTELYHKLRAQYEVKE